MKYDNEGSTKIKKRSSGLLAFGLQKKREISDYKFIILNCKITENVAAAAIQHFSIKLK